MPNLCRGWKLPLSRETLLVGLVWTEAAFHPKHFLLSVVGWESFMMNITWSPWVYRYNNLMNWWWVQNSSVGSQSQQFNIKHRKDKQSQFQLACFTLPNEVYITLISFFFRNSYESLFIFPCFFFTLLWIFCIFMLSFIMGDCPNFTILNQEYDLFSIVRFSFLHFTSVVLHNHWAYFLVVIGFCCWIWQTSCCWSCK